MEENQTSEVTTETPVAQPTQRKLTYEELENIAHQLNEQGKALTQRLREMDLANTFKRIDYLFKVLDTRGAIFSTEFIERCAKELETVLTIPEQPVEGDAETPVTK